MAGRLDGGCVDEGGKGFGEGGADTPVLEAAEMALESRVDDGLVLLRGRDQAVAVLVRPVDADVGGEGDEPVLEAVVGVVGHQLVAHARPRDVVDPRRVLDVDLRRRRPHPVHQPLKVFLCWVDVPSHVDEHGVQHRRLLRQVADVGEFADDVRHQLRQRVREPHAAAGWVEE